ncbi:hypothetical protein HMPREF1015_02109 [Bacillus smithii 7_3_47FAA]|uniref:Uncharacterized protein n=1 Tax=Bacillus smithii 7_3_47FAA TaxID=665952 RepID=G9QIU8_9BACI|nr:hypothetical protein HMPREF1015_02109 [Bacillus smithii 7_3_47FAA]
MIKKRVSPFLKGNNYLADLRIIQKNRNIILVQPANHNIHSQHLGLAKRKGKLIPLVWCNSSLTQKYNKEMNLKWQQIEAIAATN